MNAPEKVHEQRERVMAHLAREGYKPEIDKDGDVRFKKEGGTYFVQLDASDQLFFRVGFPNFWPIESEDERLRVYAACNRTNATIKVAKVFAIKDNVWGSLELLLQEPGDFEALFERGVILLQHAVSMFANEMRSAATAGE